MSIRKNKDLENINNVEADDATDGQTLKYDSTDGVWRNADDLGEENAGIPDAPLDSLTYARNSGAWVETLDKDEITGLVATSVDGLTFAGLDDVDVATVTDGQLLKYNATEGKWENTAPNAHLPRAEITLVDNPVPTAFLQQNAWKPVNGIFNFNNIFANDFEMLINNELVYTSSKPTFALYTLSFTATKTLTRGTRYEVAIFNNEVQNITSSIFVLAAEQGSFTLHGSVALVQNDVLSIRIKDLDRSDDVIVQNGVFNIIGY